MPIDDFPVGDRGTPSGRWTREQPPIRSTSPGCPGRLERGLVPRVVTAATLIALATASTGEAQAQRSFEARASECARPLGLSEFRGQYLADCEKHLGLGLPQSTEPRLDEFAYHRCAAARSRARARLNKSAACLSWTANLGPFDFKRSRFRMELSRELGPSGRYMGARPTIHEVAARRVVSVGVPTRVDTNGELQFRKPLTVMVPAEVEVAERLRATGGQVVVQCVVAPEKLWTRTIPDAERADRDTAAKDVARLVKRGVLTKAQGRVALVEADRGFYVRGVSVRLRSCRVGHVQASGVTILHGWPSSNDLGVWTRWPLPGPTPTLERSVDDSRSATGPDAQSNVAKLFGQIDGFNDKMDPTSGRRLFPGGGGMGFRGTPTNTGTGRISDGNGGRDDPVKIGGKGKGKAKIKARVIRGEPQVGEYCATSNIQSVVRRGTGDIRDCFERQLGLNPELSGTVIVDWTVNLEGKVLKAQVASSSMRNTMVETCMTRVVERWRFAPPQGGVCTIAYPFTFDGTR